MILPYYYIEQTNEGKQFFSKIQAILIFGMNI